MITRVMRYQIIKPIDCNWEEFGRLLEDLKYNTREILNKSILLSWEYSGFSSEYKNKYGEYPKNKEILGYKDISSYCYDKFKTRYYIFNTSNLITTIQKATKKWKIDLKEILKGEKSIPNYKKDIPIDLHNKTITIIKEENNYYANLSLISTKYRKEIDKKDCKFLVLLKAKDNTQKVILERILNGEYSIAASEIIKSKKKWFLNLAYKFEPKPEELNPNNIMGIDIGIVYPIYYAFNNSLKRGCIEGGEIEQFRKQVEKRRNSLKKQVKYCGNGRKGRGYKTRNKPVLKIGNKIANFRNTTNHKYSKYIIDMAIKNNCGTIQMENLSGISKDNVFLKNWSYYDLQRKIEYKAEEKGIKINYIIPDYTSQRCSECGFIHNENRETQSEFVCKKCGFKANADYNAAKNIATDNIESIILEQLKEQSVKNESFNKKYEQYKNKLKNKK